MSARGSVRPGGDASAFFFAAGLDHDDRKSLDDPKPLCFLVMYSTLLGVTAQFLRICCRSLIRITDFLGGV